MSDFYELMKIIKQKKDNAENNSQNIVPFLFIIFNIRIFY